MPFEETLDVRTPISPYAASKLGAEAIGYTYSELHGFDVTVLRYFTVYGPAGRPDMAPFRFTEWCLREEEIQLLETANNRETLLTWMTSLLAQLQLWKSASLDLKSSTLEEAVSEQRF